MQRFTTLLSRFRKDERGVFMVIFAILAIVLIATSGAVVDFTRIQQARTRAQTALDATALALQSQVSTQTAEQLKVKAQAVLTERIADSSITAVVTSATPDTTAGKLQLVAYVDMQTYFVQLVGVKSVRANLQAEVTRASNDLEVGLALDVTQSMSGTKIDSLIIAANSLIDKVIKTAQTPTYSKMAIAPYSMAVNVGSYSDEARGDVPAAIAINKVAWTSLTALTIDAISKANPAVITTSATHNLTAGDYIYLSGIKGMTQISSGVYRVGTVNPSGNAAKTFQLKTQANANVNSTNYSTYTTSNKGSATKCQTVDCKITVTTSSNHGFADGDYIYITSSAASGLNNAAWAISGKTNTTFILEGSDPSDGSGTGGSSWCTKYGCNYYRYKTVNNGYNVYKVTNCVVERPTTTEAFTDKDPTTAPVGFYYNSGGTNCLNSQILPLTSSTTDLHALVNGLKVAGSTAGQIGLAWAWYMISPNFIKEDILAVWPTTPIDARPAPYGQKKLVKAVILMTDGIFNTIYDRGVPSADSSDLSGNANVRSATNAPLGGSIAQAEALCTAIKFKDNKTVLYTVGFDIGGTDQEDVDARDFLSKCSTPGKFYQADDAAALLRSFDEIASSLGELRLSK